MGIKTTTQDIGASGNDFLDDLEWGNFTKVKADKDSKWIDFIGDFRKHIPDNYDIGVTEYTYMTGHVEELMYIQKGDKILVVDIDEKYDYIHIRYIQINIMGTGFGTEFMAWIKDYAESKNKSTTFAIVNNPDFFDKFDWLENTYPLVYSKSQSASSRCNE